MKKYLTMENDGNDRKPSLRRFANISNLNRRLKDLVKLAESERWSIHNTNDLLYNYIFSVFDLALKQGLVIENKEKTAAVFNTGLLTPNGQDIFATFTKNNQVGEYTYWRLSDFIKDSNRWLMETFDKLPDFIVHFENQSDAYYDSSLELRKELDHILDDNYTRLPEKLKSMDETTLRTIINGAIDVSLRKVKRNNRLVVPQLYFGEITYLLPIDLVGEKFALAVEKINKQYRANTILTLDMAYMQARLVMKPESDWLSAASLSSGASFETKQKGPN